MEKEKFRDSIATVDKEGKRSWVYPKKPSGKFYDYRKYVSYLLLGYIIHFSFFKVKRPPVPDVQCAGTQV